MPEITVTKDFTVRELIMLQEAVRARASMFEAGAADNATIRKAQAEYQALADKLETAASEVRIS